MAPNGEHSNKKHVEIEVKPKKSEYEHKAQNRNNFSETFESIKKNANVDTFVKYAKDNTQDTIAYILMIFGMIWALFQGFYGETLVGLVAGFYLSKELIYLIKNYKEFTEVQGMARSLILAGTIFVLFISAPGVFIGAAIMTGIKFILSADKRK